MQKLNTQTQQQTPKFNPTITAKKLDLLLEENIGVFFSNLVKVEDKNLIILFLELSNEAFLEAVDRLSIHKINNALVQTPSDLMTDFLQRLESLNGEYANKLQKLMNEKAKREYLELSQYDETQAGAYMEKEFLGAKTSETIKDVKDKVRVFRKEEEGSYIIKLFVIDENDKFIATLHFSDLILFDDDTTIKEIVEKLKPHQPLSILPTTPVEEVIRLFDEFDLSVLAVVDEKGSLKGRILYDDIYELIQRINTDQVYKMAGVDDEAEEESFFSAQRMRLIWLFVNLATIITASFVIDNFKETIASYIALAALLPLVAALGGNAGMQAMTVTIRKIALGEVAFSQVFSVLRREILIVLINGLFIASSVALITYLWFDDKMLSLVIAIAMLINLIVAGSVGALIPLVLKKIGIDPAIASSILLTTTTDIFGFFIFLFLAKMVLM
jgi:magnesium transporter